jgi:hypothetical protein
MGFLHTKSEAITNHPGLDYFTIPGTQIVIDKSDYEEYQPIQNFADGVPIEFSISGSGNEVIDMAATRLLLEGHIEKKVEGGGKIKSSNKPETSSNDTEYDNDEEEQEEGEHDEEEEAEAEAAEDASGVGVGDKPNEAAAAEAGASGAGSGSGGGPPHKRQKLDLKTSKDSVLDDVCPVNGLHSSLFADCQVKLGGTLVSSVPGDYPYISYFSNTFSFGPTAEKSHLQMQLYRKDTPGHMQKTGGKNKGAQWRRSFTDNSKVVQLLGPLYCDIFTTPRYLLNQIDMHIKLIPKESAFYLMAKRDDYKFKITKAVLYVRKLQISSTKMIDIHKSMQDNNTAKFPYDRFDVKKFKIQKGEMTKTQDHIYIGVQPKRVIMGFLRDSSYSGKIDENPFNFIDLDIASLTLTSAGQSFPGTPLRPDFTNNGKSVRSYETLFSGTGINHGDDGFSISRKAYSKGYTFWIFDLTPDQSAATGGHWNNPKMGNFRVDVHLNKSLKFPVICLIMGEFDALMQIDNMRKVNISS